MGLYCNHVTQLRVRNMIPDTRLRSVLGNSGSFLNEEEEKVDNLIIQVHVISKGPQILSLSSKDRRSMIVSLNKHHGSKETQCLWMRGGDFQLK